MLSLQRYEITNVTHNDINYVYNLLVANRPYVGLNSRYTYFLLAKDFSNTCLIAKAGSEIVAFSSGYVIPKKPETFFNWEVVVEKNHRGKGLQKALLLEQLRLTKAKFLELTINPSNDSCKKNVVDLARILNSLYTEQTLFTEQDFGNDGHEAETLFRVGPIEMTRLNFLATRAFLRKEIPLCCFIAKL
jgi:L-2,4-diaminobutyric acid acetyltransferase